MICLQNITKLIHFCLIPSGNRIRFVHKVRVRTYPMDNPTVYFRILQDSDRFQVILPFKDKTLNIERDFNFDRQLTEPVQLFLTRVKSNVEKLLINKGKRKKKGNPDTETINVSIEILKSGIPLSDSVVCKDVFFNGYTSDLRFIVNGVDYLISVNTPWVSAIALPSCIMQGFPIFPVKLELLFCDKADCIFYWFRSKIENKNTNILSDSIEWESLQTGFTYTPCIEDLGFHLKLECLPTDKILQGPLTKAVSSQEVGAGPGFCPFETRHKFTSNHLKGKEFRVASYNILSDYYAETEEALNNLFMYCPRYALSYDYRRQLLLKEIIGYNADIMCLQEVDDKAFENDLNTILTPLGYSGCFSQKGGSVREGVACFYLHDRFNCKSSDTVILAKELQTNSCFADIWELVSKKEPLMKRITERSTALQVIVLESKDNPGEVLVIGNTHLYFHPDADHVRLLQAGIIVKYLTNVVSRTASNNPGCHVSLLICGDFNSVPECGIFQLMTRKHVPSDFIDWQSNPEESVEGLELNQPWNLESACGTPKYTNFTVGFADCLDYIFYQTDRLAVKQVIPLPSEEELKQHTAIPSVVFPSDHIALVADLSWRNS